MGNPYIGDFGENAPAAPSSSPTGSVLPYIGSLAPQGWLKLAGESLGNSSSGATHANSEYEALWKLLYDEWADAQAPVSGGRTNRDADWTAGKSITLPDLRGRCPIGAAQGAGLTNRIIGENGGEEQHILVYGEIPSHGHVTKGKDVWSFGNTGIPENSGNRDPVSQVQGQVGGTTRYTSVVGSDGPHNNMQPFLALNFIIKI